MIKINDKKFLKYINETILDFKATGMCHIPGLLESLKNIKKNKALDILTSTILFRYLESNLNNRIIYIVAPELLIEHKYMNKFLLKYYIFNQNMTTLRKGK